MGLFCSVYFFNHLEFYFYKIIINAKKELITKSIKVPIYKIKIFTLAHTMKTKNKTCYTCN